MYVVRNEGEFVTSKTFGQVFSPLVDCLKDIKSTNKLE